jgi:hypothetical protein
LPKGEARRRIQKRNEKGRKHRAAMQRLKTQHGQDIGKIPACKNPERRDACLNDFALFCKTYWPDIFRHPWSEDLKKVIRKIVRVVLYQDMLAVAMPRGSGKSSLCRAGILWGVLSGRHQFAMLIGAVAADGAKALAWFKKTLSENALLYEDFPEVCYPIRLLENEPRRCLGQRFENRKTNITWGKTRIVLPTIPGTRASGHVIESTSLLGQIVGAWAMMSDGSIARPTLVMPDDPQTPKSARSQGPNGQTTYRLQVIVNSVQGLAGPDRQVGILVPCTVMQKDDLADQLTDRNKYPDFHGERTKRLYAWPKNKALWEQYRELRNAASQDDREPEEAMEFYRCRRARCGKRLDESRDCEVCPHVAECMDAGARVDWADRMDDPRNLSALQGAMHAFYKLGPAGFATEMQNEPLTGEAAGDRLTPEVCASRFSGRPYGEVPIECTDLVMGADLQQSSVWYAVLGLTRDFTGHVVEYGVCPSQPQQVFTLDDVKASGRNFQVLYPHRGVEAQIQAGLEDFVSRMLARNFVRAGGAGMMRIGRMLVDSGRWGHIVQAVKLKVGGEVMTPSLGKGIKAGDKPMSAQKRKPGERRGDHWCFPKVSGTKEFPHCALDTNYWKSFLHRRFLTAPGDPGALTLFGDTAARHSLFASHMTAETYEAATGERTGIRVEQWEWKPSRPDNHWLDALVYAMVAGSIQGVSLGGSGSPVSLGRRRVTYAELKGARR